MDTVSDNGSLLELVTLYRTNQVAADTASVKGRAWCRELEFRFLHPVFAKVGGA